MRAATVLYFHGGGFILGGLDSHDDVCAELVRGRATMWSRWTIGWRRSIRIRRLSTMR